MKDEEIKSYLEDLKDFFRNPTYEVLQNKYFGNLGHSSSDNVGQLVHCHQTEESRRRLTVVDDSVFGAKVEPEYEVVITPFGKIVLGRLESDFEGVFETIKKYHLEIATKNIINTL